MSSDAVTDLDAITDLLKPYADPKKADGMRAYMRNQFQFLGIPTPVRRKAVKDILRAAKSAGTVDWAFVDACWSNQYREMQYVGADYISAAKDSLTAHDLRRIDTLIRTKSWWDTADMFNRVVSSIGLRDPAARAIVLKWSTHRNFWLRRVAIDHQIHRKDLMDTELLDQILVNNLGQTEFFVIKAIGWALRDYSKTDPEWVRDFIERHRTELAPLSIREASKYL